MKKGLFFIFFLMAALTLYSQRDTAAINPYAKKDLMREAGSVNVVIYPVPVRENNFTIRSDREISSVKITNIIGQDIFKSPFGDQQIVRIFLNNTKRGMYLVTINFSDGTRVVRKIMVEESE